MPMFLQIDDCCADNAADAAFDALYKAVTEGAQGDEALFAPHPNPWIAATVEETAAALGARLQIVADAFALALAGKPLVVVAKAFALPWDTDKAGLDAARLYLAGLDPAHYSLEDWLLLVDVLMEETLPPSFAASTAERMVVRGDLLGRVQALVPPHQPLDLRTLVGLVPAAVASMPAGLLRPIEVAIVRGAAARAAVHITDVTDQARSMMKRAVIDHTTAMVRGDREGSSTRLQMRLFERFADQNRDMRRVAVTEIGEAHGQGFVAATPTGSRVKRVERYTGACDYCAAQNGRVMTVVAEDYPNKDGETMIWPGKTNVGRSASPRKKVGGALVDRPAHERFWVAAGVFHPNCRGRWVPIAPPDTAHPHVAPAFRSWLDDLIEKAQAPAPGSGQVPALSSPAATPQSSGTAGSGS
jgi:hypothetical protein